uniref:copper chaperone PCu(A)C n=1 Tax=Altererythrobacter segetis TaxID=1104773 RepID=UPI00140E0A99|nr:copper chaperone PCu(A)C [Altererythrobacter segetis]
MKSVILAPLALVLATLMLAGCESRQAPAADESANAAKPISITDARLVLPAVKGNPGAVYFTVHNDSTKDVTVTGAEVEGAKEAMIHQSTMVGGMSEMHEMPDALVPARGTLAFAPGGFHVMAVDLDDTLAKGGTTEVTLTFGSGEKAVFPAEVLAAGDAR